MPLKKVFIGDSESVLYEARKEFPNSKVVSTKNPDTFKVNSIPSLIDRPKTIIFTGVEIFDEDFLKYFIDLPKIETVWLFKQLRSNSKFYKYLSSKVEITKCVNLKKYKDKKSFVQGLLKEHEIPSTYLYQILQKSSESRSRIEQEVRKLGTAMHVLDYPMDCFISDIAAYDIFNLLDAILEKDRNECLKLLNKMENLDVMLLANLFTSYINCYMFLAEGDEKSALDVWNIPRFQLGDKKALAKRIGLKNLVKLSNLVKNTLLDYYSRKPAESRIRQFVFEALQ